MSRLEQLLGGMRTGYAQRADARIQEEAEARRAAAAAAGETDTPRFRGWRKRKRAARVRPPPTTCEHALEAWHAERRSEYGITTIDDAHRCTVVGCVRTGSVQCIDADLRLYGCVNSGQHHVCGVDRGCHQLYTTADGGVFCVFSRRFVETYIDSTRYGEKMLETDLDLGAPVPFHAEDVRAARKRRRNEVRAERRAAREAAADGAVVVAGVPTRLRFGMAIPEKVRDMAAVAADAGVDARALAGDCGGDDSRVDGCVAIDGTDEVGDTLVATRVRALMSAAPQRSIAAPPPSPSRALVRRDQAFAERMERLRLQQQLGPPKDYLTRYTRSDIDSIAGALFDTACRTALYKRQAAVAAAAARDAIACYYAACEDARVRPSASECDLLYERAVQRVPQVTGAGLGPALRKRYVAFLYELWRVVIETPYFRAKRNSVRLASHTLGALYMLREPFAIASPDGTVAATVLEEPDAFLVETLPPPALLRDWDARVTVHSAARVVAIKGAPGGCIEFSMKCVSSGRNAIKAALLSIETDGKRAAVAERLRAAYEDGTFEDDSEVYRDDGDDN